MSALPFLAATKIERPKPAHGTVRRGLSQSLKPRCMTAIMPRGAKPAPITAAPELMMIPRAMRISCENKIDDLMRGVSFATVEYETISSLIICLKERKRKALHKGDYDLSQGAENMIIRLNGMRLQKRFQAIKVAKLSELTFLLQEAEEKLQAATERWNVEVEEFNEQQAKATEALERAQVEKLKQFDANVPTALPMNYCKLSGGLLDMREQERQLVLTKRYTEAKALKRLCDSKEKVETEQQMDKFMKVVHGRRQKLIVEQQHAVECFTLRWTRQSEKLIARRDNDLRTHQKIIENIMLKTKEAEAEEISLK